MVDTTKGPKTIFLDIDGCLIKHEHRFSEIISGLKKPEVLGSSVRTCMRWHCEGHKIILVTGRPEPYRKQTEKTLQSLGIVYDVLVMGCGPGPRILINDIDPESPDVKKAIAINLDRDEGISKLKL